MVTTNSAKEKDMNGFPREVYVISDLHLGGHSISEEERKKGDDRGFRMFTRIIEIIWKGIYKKWNRLKN